MRCIGPTSEAIVHIITRDEREIGSDEVQVERFRRRREHNRLRRKTETAEQR